MLLCLLVLTTLYNPWAPEKKGVYSIHSYVSGTLKTAEWKGNRSSINTEWMNEHIYEWTNIYKWKGRNLRRFERWPFISKKLLPLKDKTTSLLLYSICQLDTEINKLFSAILLNKLSKVLSCKNDAKYSAGWNCAQRAFGYSCIEQHTRCILTSDTQFL